MNRCKASYDVKYTRSPVWTCWILARHCVVPSEPFSSHVRRRNTCSVRVAPAAIGASVPRLPSDMRPKRPGCATSPFETEGMTPDGTLILESERLRIEPLREGHLSELAAACNDPAIFEFTYSTNPFATPDDARAWFERMTSIPTQLLLAIVDKPSGRVVGSTRYIDIDPANRKLEIGGTMLSPAVWRTHVNTECKYLLLRYAFETFGANRVQLKGEAKNARSRAAMARIGATFEGTLRSFRVHASGEIRDTSFYSIIASEWPAVKARLESLLRR